MTDTPTPPRRTLRLVLAVIGVAVLVLALTLYATRRIIAREALTGWLQSKGIASEADVETFGLTGAAARLRIGDPGSPDLVVQRAEVGYALRGFRLEVSSVRLTKAVLRASVRGGKLSVGALDPLIEEFRRRPPQPDARKPRVQIEDGVLLLATDYGPVRVAADALVNDGKLVSLAAESAPARLRGRDFDVSAGAGVLRVTTRGARAFANLDAPINEARAAGASLTGGRLRLTAGLPYPDLERKRGDGRVVIRGNLTARRLALGDQDLVDAQLGAGFTGESRGWIADLELRGESTADLRTGSAAFAGGRAGSLRANIAAPDLVWTRRGGDAVTGTVRIRAGADALAVSELRLQTISVRAEGPATWGAGSRSLRLAGAIEGQGGWMGLGLPTTADSRDLAAIKRGVRDFRLAAPGLAVTLGDALPQFRLTQPVRLTPRAGGEVSLAPQGAGWRLAMAGGGLPEVDADVRRFQLTQGGATAAGRVRAGLSIGPIEDGRFDASGTLRVADGAVRFVADRCAVIRATRLELGENDVEGLSGRLCPMPGQPLLWLAGQDWRISGRAQDTAAAVPFLQARAAQADGRVSMGMARGRMDGRASIGAAILADAAPETRFNPLKMTGEAVLVRDVWTADVAFATPAGQPVAQARLRHDGRTARGDVEFDTGALTFAEGGLQPERLSPLAAAVGSPASGSVQFAGRLQWGPEGVTSGGTLSVPRLDFQSPAGRVTGLSGKVVFTSLAPLIAAPGQQLRAEAVDAVLPLTGVTASFGLEEGGLLISGGEAAVGGGRVTVESVRIPLTPDQPTRGVLNLEGVQLHDIVEASPFGDKVEFDARVSGRIPFEVQQQRVRIMGGSLRAIAPGRISIQRTALTGVAASTALTAPGAPLAPEPSTDTFTDFAYQAMENLAFDTLEATISSREDGRLGVLFHIIGEHDPPQKQEIRLGILDLIQRNFMNRKLPLPSGTGVDLTLDTTLNLDDLLNDYAEYQRLRSSPTVQP